MAWQLYIVSRHQPLIYGYLQVALERRRPESFEIIFDRRQPESASVPSAGPDRRRNDAVEAALLERGYAVVSVRGRRPGAGVGQGVRAGALWRRSPAWSLAAALLVVVLAGGGVVAVLVSGQRDEVRELPAMAAPPAHVAALREVERPAVAGSATEPGPPAGPMTVLADASAHRDEPAPLASAPGDQAGQPQPAVLVSPAERSEHRTRSGPPAVRRDAGARGAAVPAPRRREPRSRQVQAAAGPSAEEETSQQETGPIGPPRVEVLRAAGAGSRALTIRLSNEDGYPVADAQVWVVGRAADGSEVQSPLAPASALGLYRGSLPARVEAPAALVLRVTVRASRFEVPVPR